MSKIVTTTIKVTYSSNIEEHCSDDNVKAEEEFLENYLKDLWPGTIKKFRIIYFKKGCK